MNCLIEIHSVLHKHKMAQTRKYHKIIDVDTNSECIVCFFLSVNQHMIQEYGTHINATIHTQMNLVKERNWCVETAMIKHDNYTAIGWTNVRYANNKPIKTSTKQTD